MNDNCLLKIENLSRNYSGTQALKGVSMEVKKGEILGLIGENGAGKSTLLRIIAGVEQPDGGTLTMNGKPYKCSNPFQANKQGVGMVFQEQSLIKNLTVGQNIFLGREDRYTKCKLINWKKMYKDAAEILKGENIDASDKIADIDFATRQLVEILKVFNIVQENSENGALILLDEPTSVLNEKEINKLYKKIRELKESGNSVIFVSHRLDEVLEISDRIYIFKDGKNVGEVDKNDADENILQEKMVGRLTNGQYFKTERQTTPSDEVVLEVKHLGQRGFFKDVNFKLHKGEVLGICGVVGSGKENLCATICGDEAFSEGEILVDNIKKDFTSPSQALKSGVLSVPKERRDEGILGVRSIYENICMSNFSLVTKNWFISKKDQIDLANKWIDELQIKCNSPLQNLENLSGGNAQKVVFARIISSQSHILILNHPTRGVDVGAKEDIYNIIRDITEKGMSVIMLGDTLDESIGMSNRIIVMKDGVTTKEFDCPVDNKPSQVEIVKYMV